MVMVLVYQGKFGKIYFFPILQTVNEPLKQIGLGTFIAI